MKNVTIYTHTHTLNKYYSLNVEFRVRYKYISKIDVPSLKFAPRWVDFLTFRNTSIPKLRGIETCNLGMKGEC